MRLDLREIAETEVLAGADNGRSILVRLLEATRSEPAEPEPLFLDFSRIDVATASFLRESVLALRDIARNRRSNQYPVVANPNDLVRDELAVLADARGVVVMTCVLDDDGNVISTSPIGSLDPKQKMTFEIVCEHGETDAGELMRKNDDGVRHTTAWNNRLSSLASMGLIMEISRGRSKRYRPLFMENS